MNSQSSMSAKRQRKPRPSTTPSLTTERRPSYTRPSSSATPASRTACTGRPKKASHPARWARSSLSATAEGYTANPQGHTPFHGYYFHPLKGQTDKSPGGAKEYMVDGKMSGGFALVAYPAEYGNSGVMTFIINQDGVLLREGSRQVHHGNSKRNDLVRSRSQLGHRTALVRFQSAREKRSLDPRASLSSPTSPV